MNSNDNMKNIDDSNNDNKKTNITNEMNINNTIIHPKKSSSSLDKVDIKEKNKNIHMNKSFLPPSTSDTISYKWKEDNNSYNISSQSLDKNNNKNNYNFSLPKVDKRYDFLIGKEYSMSSISQEKNISNNPKRKPILLINKDLASHIINENNLLLKKIKALHNYSYNVCYNANKDNYVINQNSNSSLSINSMNINNTNLSKKISYNINTYNGNINKSRTSTPSTDILFPPIQTKKNKRRYY
ncbi:hypothetical protein PIROE2DRAFT_5515 [Piromyces sp. E2]|nr:hypothetical protein PIROE2DRAFT_5515 [Piromyces sp. E2]|eukprot:OUM67133.1 hypothetical protein PIROE2DRAFT_5515 [Piromyces sp. E2]